MNTTHIIQIRLRHVARILVSTLATAVFALTASAAALDSWTQVSGTISDTDTDHPTFGSGSTSMTASFSAVTLDTVGDTLTLSGQVAFDFSGTSGANAGFRWGLFDNNGSSTNKGWDGYMVANSSSVAWLEKKQGGGEWNSTAEGSGFTAITDGITGGSSGGTPFTDGTYDFSLSITRATATSVTISWSLTGTGSSTYSLVGSYTDTAPLTNFSIDRVVIHMPSNFGQNTAAFSNLDLTQTSTIPEPAAIALLNGLGALLVALIIRRRRA